jgi:leukotriene-A4 hydrolase
MRLPSCWVLAVWSLAPIACAQSPEGEVVQDPSSPSSQPAPSTSSSTPAAAPVAPATSVADPHSFARPEEASVRHLRLDLDVDFATRRLAGTAVLDLDRAAAASEVVLDTWGLEIEQVLDHRGAPAEFELGSDQGLLGRALRIALAPDAGTVTVRYRTSPEATALQWLEPRQTAGGGQPFLFTQSQAILARTWIPLQDTPSVRFTYQATVRVPPALLAVMSAENPQRRSSDGVYSFRMPQAIPSYLMALAVGDLEFRELGPRSGVYAEPSVVEGAAWELEPTEAMIDAAERLYGQYRWGRYDLLVLPPSFPFGGMENPRLTFATPTILAGDRSLVSLVAHELAHSWSGNLVTNATWNDFWLNEGFTTYFENRIMEELYGRDTSESLALLSRQELEEEIRRLGPDHPDTRLALTLEGRDPDDGMTPVAYDKGYLFLRLIEESVGRERWDAFLKRYFDRFAFQSMTTARFLGWLEQELLASSPGVSLQSLQADSWIHGPGLPPNAPLPRSDAFARVDAELARWRAGTPAAQLASGDWDTQARLHFVRQLPPRIDRPRLAELDAALGLTATGNSEVLSAWLLYAIEHDYEPAYPALESFLLRQGRRKFLKPLYEALARTAEGRRRALAIYQRARPGYHAVAVKTVDAILGWNAA